MFNMIDTFNKFLSEDQLVSQSNKVLLAVSGGADSMAMLALFCSTTIKIGVVHLNHGMRAAESDKDEDLCKSYCLKAGIPFYSKKVDLNHIKSNFQEEARKIRFEYFQEIMRKESYDLLATAHHKNDQVENFFLRINRQAGLQGLSGMKLRSGNLIHPMLFANKAQISKFIKSHGVPFREDQSNLESKYQRNFVRNEVIPLIKKKFPKFEENLSASIQHLSEYNGLFGEMLSQLKSNVVSIANDTITIDLNEISRSQHPKFLLYLILKDRRLNRTQSDNIYDAKVGTSIDLEGFTILKDRDVILIKKMQTFDHPEINFTLEHLGQIYDLGNGKSIKIEQVEKIENQGKFVIFLDGDKVEFPLQAKVRGRLPGDIFFPAGMGMKRKKLKKYLVDQKLNNFDKSDVLIMTNAIDEIIWVIGYRQDERFVANDDSKTLLRVSYIAS